MGMIPFSYIWGSLADHFGRRPVLIASAVLMTMSTLVLAFSVSYTMTVAFRVVLGFCSGKYGVRICSVGMFLLHVHVC